MQSSRPQESPQIPPSSTQSPRHSRAETSPSSSAPPDPPPLPSQPLPPQPTRAQPNPPPRSRRRRRRPLLLPLPRRKKRTWIWETSSDDRDIITTPLRLLSHHNHTHTYHTPFYNNMEKGEAQDKLGELQRITEILLDRSRKDTPEALDCLNSLFDLLLWAEKRNQATLDRAVQSQLMTIVLEKYKDNIQVLVSGFILILGNAREEGPLIKHILENRMPDQVLHLYLAFLALEKQLEEQQHLHTLGSYLKAYHRHLVPNSIEWLIKEGRCLLISISCQFFNCPEQITRTSIMNILMTVLKSQVAPKLLALPLVKREIHCWCLSMCRLLRNELKDFDQNLLTTQQSQSEYIIHLINDKVCLWEDLSAISETLFAETFYQEIVVPLVVGSLNTNGIPLFTLKFSLFILDKLLKTIRNLDLLGPLGQLLFLNQTITYLDCQMGTASLRPFSLRRLLQGMPENDQEQSQLNEFSQVNQLFLNILRTKDSRFLECVSTLLFHLFSQVRKHPKCAHYFNKQLRFGINGSNLVVVSQILVNQFNALHSLQINKLISCLLVHIQPSRHLAQDARYRFFHTYRTLLEQALRNIEKHRQNYDYVTELFEYDAKMIASPSFGFSQEGLQLKTDAALIFNNQIIENESQPFYRMIPESDNHIIRYGLAKTLLLRRLAITLIEDLSAQRTLERYLQRVRSEQARWLKPGEYLKLPITCNSYRCKLLDEKIEIPNCLLLEDDNNLIIGYLDNMQVKVVINIKLKHVSPTFKAKKDRVFAEIQIRKYDHHNTQDLVPMKGIVLKSLDVGAEYFKVKKRRICQKEAASIGQVLRNAKKSIPEMSLI